MTTTPTKANIFEELILKLFNVKCELEPIGEDKDHDVQRESRVCEGERAGNVDRRCGCSDL
jgi:hypothetical protein